MPEKMRGTLDDLEVVVNTAIVDPHTTPPSVSIGFAHISGRAARLGVPNPKTKVSRFLLTPDAARQLATDLLAAVKAATSPSTH